MNIDRGYLIIICMVFIGLVWYIKTLKEDSDRFKNIIDNFIDTSEKDNKKDNKELDKRKSSIKKVKFDEKS